MYKAAAGGLQCDKNGAEAPGLEGGLGQRGEKNKIKIINKRKARK